jgi:predicted DNA-binding transcriptional regulator AlpA
LPIASPKLAIGSLPSPHHFNPRQGVSMRSSISLSGIGQVVGPLTIIRKKVVFQRTGLSDTTIWRMEKAGDFPRRVQLTDAGAVGWVEAEVDQWIHDRVRGCGKRPARRGA